MHLQLLILHHKKEVRTSSQKPASPSFRLDVDQKKLRAVEFVCYIAPAKDAISISIKYGNSLWEVLRAFNANQHA